MRESSLTKYLEGEKLEFVSQRRWLWNEVNIEGGLGHSFIVSKYCLYILTQTLISCHVTMIRDKRELRYRLPEIAIYDIIDRTIRT